MSELLPVVQKAQPPKPFQVGDEPDSWDYDADEMEDFIEAVERERLGYEKREQTLKNKIEKQAERILNLRLAFVEEVLAGECKDAINADNDYQPTEKHLRTGCFDCCFVKDLDISYDELLGLSKQ